MHKLIFLLFIIAGLLATAIFSFNSAYSESYIADLQVKKTYTDVIESADSLAVLSVKVGALALEFLPEGRIYVSKLEKAAQQIKIRESVDKIVGACVIMHATMQHIFFLLDENTNAKNDYHVKDAKLQFDKITRDLKINAKRYNLAAEKYNNILKKSIPNFWKKLIDAKPAELFKPKIKSKN